MEPISPLWIWDPIAWFVASSRYGEDYVVPETKVDRHAFNGGGGFMEDLAKEFEVLSDRPEKRRKTEVRSLNAVFDTMNSRNEESFERFGRLVEEDTHYVTIDEEEKEESSSAGEDCILEMNEEEEDGKRGSTSEDEDESPDMEKRTTGIALNFFVPNVLVDCVVKCYWH